MPYSDGEVAPDGDEFIPNDYDDEDLEVHTGATSGRSGVALTPKAFSSWRSPTTFLSSLHR